MANLQRSRLRDTKWFGKKCLQQSSVLQQFVWILIVFYLKNNENVLVQKQNLKTKLYTLFQGL